MPTPAPHGNAITFNDETDGILHIGDRPFQVKTLTSIKGKASKKKSTKDLGEQISEEVRQGLGIKDKRDVKGDNSVRKVSLVEVMMSEFNVEGHRQEVLMLAKHFLGAEAYNVMMASIPYVGMGMTFVDGIKNAAKAVKDVRTAKNAANILPGSFSHPILFHAAKAAQQFLWEEAELEAKLSASSFASFAVRAAPAVKGAVIFASATSLGQAILKASFWTSHIKDANKLIETAGYWNVAKYEENLSKASILGVWILHFEHLATQKDMMSSSVRPGCVGPQADMIKKLLADCNKKVSSGPFTLGDVSQDNTPDRSTQSKSFAASSGSSASSSGASSSAASSAGGSSSGRSSYSSSGGSSYTGSGSSRR